MRAARVTSSLFGIVLVACGGSEGGVDAGSAGDAGIDAPIAMDAGTDAQAPIDGALPDAGAPPDAPGTASLVGVVTRSADGSFLDPPPDGRGDLYVYLYDSNPADTTVPANRVAEFTLADVDLSTPEREIPYALYGIPPRPEAYWVAAFLDDDEDGPPDAPRPNMGDSVATSGGAAPQIVVDAAGEQAHDVDLNLALFFTP